MDFDRRAALVPVAGAMLVHRADIARCPRERPPKCLDPQVIHRVPDTRRNHALPDQTPPGCENGKRESELDPPHAMQAPGDVGILPAKLDGGVEPSDLFQRVASTDKVPTLDHGACPDDEAIDELRKKSHPVKEPRGETGERGRIEVALRPAQTDQCGILGESP